MKHDKTDDATEFARQAVERGVLNEVVTEEQRQRQQIENVIAEMRIVPRLQRSDRYIGAYYIGYSKAANYFADQLEAILKR